MSTTYLTINDAPSPELGEKLDWAWTVDVQDWAIDTRADLREEIESVADQFRSPSSDIPLFHDAGTAPDLLDELLETLRTHDVAFGDPLELVAE